MHGIWGRGRCYVVSDSYVSCFVIFLWNATSRIQMSGKAGDCVPLGLGLCYSHGKIEDNFRLWAITSE